MTGSPVARSGKSAFEVATLAARQAGEIIKAGLSSEKNVRYKGVSNMVTDVDLKADSLLKSLLLKEYPDHGILTEESEAVEGDSGYAWVLDPLDGSSNYSFGIPFVSVVIALTRGAEVLLGLIYDPLRDEMFSAQKGRGAFLNDKPIRVSSQGSLRESIFGFDLGYVEARGKRTLELIASNWRKMHSIRIAGSGALGMAYVCCGRYGLYFHPTLYPWELAAGQLLVAEAGGVITDWGGNSIGIRESSAVASNPTVHAEFLKMVKEAGLAP